MNPDDFYKVFLKSSFGDLSKAIIEVDQGITKYENAPQTPRVVARIERLKGAKNILNSMSEIPNTSS